VALERTLFRWVVTRLYNLPIGSAVRGGKKSITKITPREHLFRVVRVNGNIIDLPPMETEVGPHIKFLWERRRGEEDDGTFHKDEDYGNPEEAFHLDSLPSRL